MRKNMLLFFILFLCIVCSIIFLVQEINKNESEYIVLALIIAFAINGFSFGLFIKKYSFLEFLKVLLPASISILGTIWLFSSGYLNLRAENLKREIFISKQEDSILKISVQKFRNDSIKLIKENKSLKKTNEKLRIINKLLPNWNVTYIRPLSDESKVILQVQTVGQKFDPTKLQFEYTLYNKKGNRTKNKIIFNEKLKHYEFNLPFEFIQNPDDYLLEVDYHFINRKLSQRELKSNHWIFQIAPFGASYNIVIF